MFTPTPADIKYGIRDDHRRQQILCSMIGHLRRGMKSGHQVVKISFNEIQMTCALDKPFTKEEIFQLQAQLGQAGWDVRLNYPEQLSGEFVFTLPQKKEVEESEHALAETAT